MKAKKNKYVFKANNSVYFHFEGTEKQAANELEKFAMHFRASYNSLIPVTLSFELEKEEVK